MTKVFLFGLSILVSMASCNNENCHPEKIITKWTVGKELSVSYDSTYKRNHYEIIDGNKRLFEYKHIGSQCEDIVDDEWFETLFFTTNIQTHNFEFIDEEIIETNCFYQETGAWVRHNQYQIKNGSIIGEKVSSNQWRVSVSVATTPLFEGEQPKKIEFEEIFKE